MKPLNEAVDAVAAFGFSPRQASFLALVMRHTGLCLPRQYATFAGTAYGRKVNDFFTHLVDDGWASSWPCVHNRARLYHVHHKALYRAVGDPDSRFRRAISARAVRSRIERLDALIAVPAARWFASLDELTDGLGEAGCHVDDEVLAMARTAMGSPGDAAPVMGIDEAGGLLVLYLVTSKLPDDSVALLGPTLPLLRCLSRWSIHLALTTAQKPLVPEFVRTITAALRPMPAATLTDLRWYFQERHRGLADGRDQSTAERLAVAALTYQDAQYRHLYRRWIREGERLFEQLSCPVLEEAYARFAGRVETHVLSQPYRHLDPLLQRRRSHRVGVEGGAQRGADTPMSVSTPSSTALTEEGGEHSDLPHGLDAPRGRPDIKGLRVGGAHSSSRRRASKQPSLFTAGEEDRV